jgi:hypothetical protein
MRLGDAITSATSAAGVSPCAGCKQRAERLNRLFDSRPRTPNAGTQRETPAEIDTSRIVRQLATSLTLGLGSLMLRRQLNRLR